MLVAAGCLSPGSLRAQLVYVNKTTDAGASYMIVGGQFESSDKIADFFSAVHSGNPKAIFFDSPGGNVAKAIELGRAIRLLGLPTMQIRSSECASACALAFLGGSPRFAEPGSIGVHKSSFADTTGMSVETAVSVVQQMTAEVIAYMTEMGVDPALLQLALQYDSSDIRYLSGSEMLRYRVATNFDANGKPEVPAPSVPAVSPGQIPAEPQVASLPPTITVTTPRVAPPSLVIPPALFGRIQHPKGFAELKVRPEAGSPALAAFSNGTPVSVVTDGDKWFKVSVGGRVGYMYHAWVWIAQYDAVSFGRKFVQVKSFDNLAETEAYIRNSPIPLAAYLATNGWFAITLADNFPDGDLALKLSRALKEKGAIPDDSVATYGNAYVRKVCCTR